MLSVRTAVEAFVLDDFQAVRVVAVADFTAFAGQVSSMIFAGFSGRWGGITALFVSDRLRDWVVDVAR